MNLTLQEWICLCIGWLSASIALFVGLNAAGVFFIGFASTLIAMRALT